VTARAELAASPPVAAASRLEGVAWLVLLPVALGLVAQAAWSGDAVVAMHFAVLLAFGSLLFRGTQAHLFRLAFALGVGWVYVLADHYTGVGGAPFTGGGDDLLFHETSARIGASWAAGDWGAAARYANYSGFGYILLGALLHVVSLPLGEAGPLAIRIWGAFAGATIGPAAWLLARALLPERGARFWTRTAVAAGLFPLVLQYAALGLRDVFLAALATWTIAVLARSRAERPGLLDAWAFPAVLLTVAALFRPETAAMLVAFWLALLFARRHTAGAMAASLLVLAATIAVGVLFFDVIVAQLVQQQLSYAYAADAAGAGSLGARILRIPPPLGWGVRYLYAIITPVPPLVAVRPDTILVGLGASAWYFLVPLAASGWGLVRRRGPEQKAIVDAIVAFAAVLLAGVALTSIDVRHKLPLVPVTVVLGAAALELRDARWRHDRITAVALAGMGLGALYLILKFT
jgi:hypothetical protein